MRIVMDDAGDVPADLAQQYNIRIVPVNVMFGQEQYLSGVDIDHATFYEKTKHVDASNFPKTSQPTPYQLIECYKEILAEGEGEILTITVGEKLSGTYASAVQAVKELEGQGKFYLFDSKAATALMGFMAVEAARMVEAGKDIEAIMARLEEMREGMSAIFTVDSLEYAVKGGRVGPLKSVVASMLNLKPILSLEDGEVVEAGRVRTRKKALAHILELVHERVGDRPVKLAVMHAGVPQEAQEVLEKARDRLNPTEASTVDMCIPVAINLGPGALAIATILE